MKTLNLTQAEYQTLVRPTREDQYTGAQYGVARKVQEQIMALDGEQARLDDDDIIAINKAIEVNGVGAFIATAEWRSGGWPLSEWEQSTISLKRAVQRSDWTA